MLAIIHVTFNRQVTEIKLLVICILFLQKGREAGIINTSPA